MYVCMCINSLGFCTKYYILFAFAMVNGFMYSTYLFAYSTTPKAIKLSRFSFYHLPKGEKTFPRDMRHKSVGYFSFFSGFYEEILLSLEMSSHTSQVVFYSKE